MNRLLCITGNLGVGGAETFLMKLYRKIDKEKYQFDFCISKNADSFYEKEIIDLGGRVFRIEAKTKNPFKFKKQLMKIVCDGKYEYVLRISSNAIGFWDIKLAKKAGAKVCCARSSNSSEGNRIVSKITNLYGRILFLKYIDVALAPSDLAAKHTFGSNAYAQGRVKILNNAIDLNVFSFNYTNRVCVRKELGIFEDEIVVGHIGRFVEQKNHDFLIKVFQEIQKINHNSRLILTGNGPLEEAYRQKIDDLNLSDNVIFTGIRSDIPNILAAIDVLLLPSFFEGMPNVVIEAQALGIPCLVSDTITKNADITGLVEYISINESPNYWARLVFKKIGHPRVDTKNMFIEKKYNIEAVAEEFVHMIFEKDKW